MKKKDLIEVLNVLNRLELDNKNYIDNSGIRWLQFARIRICRLYGLSEKEIRKLFEPSFI